MNHFDERSGVVICPAPWGSWWQTIDDVCIEVNVPPGTTAKEIKCKITAHSINLVVAGKEIVKGEFAGKVVSDECVWTLEDKKVIHVVLVKGDRQAKNCWESLLKGEYLCDPAIFDKMEKKMTLERFARENPGMDFTGADITGQYQKGGPDLS